VDTCDDLYGIAKGQPEERLVIEVLPVAEIPADYAMELAQLDDNEVSTALTTADGQNLVFLMLCGRTRVLPEEVSRDEVLAQLRNQRIQAYANSYLEELKSDAHIEYLDGR
jgi:peptidyl-prolyl cis-trans isomerase SurA